MAKNKEPLTYRQNVSRQEAYRIIKAVGCPLAIFALALFTISSFANFGTKLICPASGAMWIMGVIVATAMPSMRNATLIHSMTTITIYFLALLGLKMVLGVVSGVSAEMIAASYNQVIPTATGNTIPGYIQNLLWFTAVLLQLERSVIKQNSSSSLRKLRTEKKHLIVSGVYEIMVGEMQYIVKRRSLYGKKNVCLFIIFIYDNYHGIISRKCRRNRYA